MHTYFILLWNRRDTDRNVNKSFTGQVCQVGISIFSFITMEGSSFLSLLLLPILFFDSELAVNVTLCRSRGIFLEPRQFMAETCALCYLYMPKTKFQDHFAKWNLTHSKLTFPPMGSMLTNGTLEVTLIFLSSKK